ncbi:MAG: hypothetical protein H6623_07760 [Bdellovibrionaceae bacterium]|nr:hypothetical protein [Pseudobdellovibrionaceae bacterium]
MSSLFSFIVIFLLSLITTTWFKIYLNSQYSLLFSSETYLLLINAFVLSSVLDLLTRGGLEQQSISLHIEDYDSFFNQFLKTIDELGYQPKCQMDNHFFFSKNVFLNHYSVRLTKEQNAHYTIYFPKKIKKRILKDFGIYAKIDALKKGQPSL